MQSFDTNVLSMKYVGNTEKVSILFCWCGGGGGGLYVLPKNVAVFVLQNYMIYLLQLFSPPLSFAILYVVQKITCL